MIAQAKPLKLNFNIATGVNGKITPKNELFVCCQYAAVDKSKKDFVKLIVNGKPHLFNMALTKGEVGLCLSLILILDNLIKQGIKWAILLEDDITFSTDFVTELKQLENDIPTLDYHQVDLIYLNDRIHRTKSEDGNLMKRYYPVEKGFGLDGYLISQRGMKKMIDILNPLFHPVDVQLIPHLSSFREYSSYRFVEINPIKPNVTLNGYKYYKDLITNNYEKSVIHDCPNHEQREDRIKFKST